MIANLADVLEVEPEELSLDVLFKDPKYDWDSLKGYAILVMIEEEFGVNVSVEKFIEAQTIKDLVELCREKEN